MPSSHEGGTDVERARRTLLNSRRLLAHARSCPAMHDGTCACGAQEAAEAVGVLLGEIEGLREALIPDVRVLIRDYYSGLPEDREPVDGAVTRLDHLLNNEDGEPLDAPDFNALKAVRDAQYA